MKLYFELTNHQAFLVSGADAERYLQGRITQDIKDLTESEESLLLSPQGKIQAKFIIHKKDDGYLIIADPSDNFEKDLLQFKVADQVSVEKIDTKIYSTLRETDLEQYESFRYKQENYDVLAKDDKELKEQGLKKGTEEQRLELRISSLKPEYGTDIDSSISATEIPHKNFISFTKGCYSGQEVVEMSIARGKPNKELVTLKANKKITSKDIYSTEKKEKKCGFIQNSMNEAAFAYIKSSFLEQYVYYTENSALTKTS